MSLSDLQRKSLVSRMVRINHAGEYAAKRIYQGQLAVLKGEDANIVQEMMETELEHLHFFENQIKTRRARPTLLLPLVSVAAYYLGVVTAKFGKKSAMACTIAVEEVISGHYAEQLEQLGGEEKELATKIEKFKQDEACHLDTAIENGGTKAVGYYFMSEIIKKGCQTAIKLVKYL